MKPNQSGLSAALDIQLNLCIFQKGLFQLSALNKDVNVCAGVIENGAKQTNRPFQLHASPPRQVDWTNSICTTPVVYQEPCNSAPAQAVVAAVEWCLCQAQGSWVSPRSVRQLEECTDGRKQGEETELERSNSYCEAGFPDIHLDYIVK